MFPFLHTQSKRERERRREGAQRLCVIYIWGAADLFWDVLQLKWCFPCSSNATLWKGRERLREVHRERERQRQRDGEKRRLGRESLVICMTRRTCEGMDHCGKEEKRKWVRRKTNIEYSKWAQKLDNQKWHECWGNCEKRLDSGWLTVFGLEVSTLQCACCLTYLELSVH